LGQHRADFARWQFHEGNIRPSARILVTRQDLQRIFVTVAESCGIPLLALKGLVNHSLGTDVTEGYVVLSPEERLRDPMQMVTDRLKELIGLAGPEGENVEKLTG
jgi:hypothetical protein